MAQPNRYRQLSLFPIRDSIEQLEEEALAMLPITNGNQLISLLRMQQNTLYSIYQEKIDDSRNN